MQTTNNQNPYKTRINYQIKAAQVRLIGNDGTNIGIVSLQEALRRAQEQALDLVEISAKSVPPTVKIIDYGKHCYEENKKAKAARKNQKQQEQKEITLRPSTDEGDLSHKLTQAKEFLLSGDKVKFSCRFRGREISHPQIGREKLEGLLQQLVGLIVPNPQINLEGKIMSVVILPAKNKV